MLTAGLAGGAVVAIAAGLAWSTMQPGDSGSNDKLTARLAALELKVDEIAARPAAGGAAPQAVSQLGARLDKLEKALAERPASAAGGPDPALMNRLSSAEAAVKSLGDTVSATDKRLDEALSAAEAARTQAEAAAKAADAAAPAAPGVQPAEIAALSSQIATAERTLSSLQQQVAQRSTAPISDRAVRLAVLADGLRAQVERGAPYASELAAAKQLVSDPQTFAPLEPFATTGVPSATALGRELSAVVPAMMQAADVPPGEGYLERLQAKAESLVRVRKVDQVKDAGAGADVAVVIGNAEAKARQGDLAGALESLGTLPPAVRAPAEPWIRKAEARRAAVAAARRVATAALGALANP
ncbi:COG4223 family protein [Rhodovulum sp. PH10]|uniref:COG4223 family protein n=1 Tax=Rhodovulum sp. PH10 TaxID=1187851 RepID=UPI0012FA3DF6|nr:hypothetical protein [Rhodovulum sp. PH10]